MLDQAIPDGVACPSQIFVLADTDTGDGELEEGVPYAFFDEDDLYEKREKPDLIRLREKIGEAPPPIPGRSGAEKECQRGCGNA